LSHLCDEEIRNATKSALVEHLTNSKPMIMAALKKAIAKNTDKIAVSLVDSLVNSASSNYGFTIQLGKKE